jgi:hypothetical protein
MEGMIAPRALIVNRNQRAGGSPPPIAATAFTTSVRHLEASAWRLDGTGPTMTHMDIVAVIFGVLSFALLLALLEGIDRI